MRKTTLLAIVVISMALLGFAQEPAKTPERNAADVKFADTAFARLSFLDGKAFIQRASDLAYEDLQLNMPVAAGDRIGTAEGRIEIRLAARNYARLDRNAKLDVLNLPRKEGDVTRLRGWTGSFYLDLGGLTREKDVEFLTSDVTFYILENGVYRIDVRENRETEILVFSGVVEASGEEGSVLVMKDQRLTIADGRVQGKPASFFAAPDDAFDRFNEERSTKVSRPVARKHLGADLEDYEGELDEYGDWSYENPFGYVWVPRGLAPGWMPYTYGRWTWLPMAGWCWLPYEPWGWSTFHYGRWHWSLGLGWYWIPMSGWGPGWVNWWWDDSYYAWAPMSYWGYPGIIIDNFYMGRGWGNYRNYPLNSRALTVVRKDQLAGRDVHAVVLRNDAIKGIGQISLGGSQPDVRTFASPRISTESLGGGGGVILRRGGDSAGPPASGTVTKDTTGSRGRDAGSSQAGGERKVDPQSTSRSGSTATAGKGGGTVTKGETAPPAKSSPPPERRIRKKIDEIDAGAAGGVGRAGIMGYPSRVAGAQVSSGSGASRQDSGSVLDRLYRSITSGGGNGSSSSRAGTLSRGTSSGSGSGASAPRAMPRISSSTSSSSPRSSASSGRSSTSGSSSSGRSSGGGSVRKK